MSSNVLLVQLKSTASQCEMVQVARIVFSCSVPCFQRKFLKETGGLADRLDLEKPYLFK